MRFKYLLFIPLAIVFLISSCTDKKEEQNVAKPEVKQQPVKVDTVKKKPVVEEIVEEVKPEWPKLIIVQQDEWIYDIARREYGSIFAWRKIYDANKEKISDPDLIYPGQELVLPE